MRVDGQWRYADIEFPGVDNAWSEWPEEEPYSICPFDPSLPETLRAATPKKWLIASTVSP